MGLCLFIIIIFLMLLPATVVLYCMRLFYCYRHVIITTVEGWQHVTFFTPCCSFARRWPFNHPLLRNEPNHFLYPIHVHLPPFLVAAPVFFGLMRTSRSCSNFPLTRVMVFTSRRFARKMMVAKKFGRAEIWTANSWSGNLLCWPLDHTTPLK